MGFRAVDLALAGQILAAGGITIHPEAIDTCRTCGSTYRRKNAHRHYGGRRHAKLFRRAWDSGLWQGRHQPAAGTARR